MHRRRNKFSLFYPPLFFCHVSDIINFFLQSFFTEILEISILKSLFTFFIFTLWAF